MTDTPSAPIPTHVNGQEVIADEPAQSPLSKPGESPIKYKRVRHLLLADGSAVYACAECGEYTGPAVINVIAHIRSHRRTQAAATPTPVAALSSSPAVTATLAPSPSDEPDPGPAATAALRDLIADRDAWRDRAETAEQNLIELRAAIRDYKPPTPKTTLPPDVVAHARRRLQLLGKLSRTELRAMTGLPTAGLEELSQLLVDEGNAEILRAPGGSGRSAVILRWTGPR